MKKAILLVFLAVFSTALTFAEAPEFSLGFSQEMDTAFTDGKVMGNGLSDGDALYYDTVITAGMSYSAGMITLAPWVSGEMEIGVNAGAVAADGTWFGNTAAIGLDSNFAISDMMGIYLNLELDIAGSQTLVSADDALIGIDFTPTLGVAGSISGLYYDLSEGADFTLDTTDNDSDDLALELVGTYTVGYGMAVAGMDITFDATDELTIGLGVLDAEEDTAYGNEFTFTVSASAGAVTPYAGFVYNTSTVDGESLYSLMGFTLGADVAIDAWSVGFGYTGGAESESETFEGLFAVAIGYSF